MTIVVLVGAALRFWDLGGADLWTDEVLTALRARAPFADSLDSLLHAANQMPLYYWLLRLFPNDTDFLLRLPSAALGIVGIGLVMAAIQRCWQNWELTLWVGALLAVNPYHIMLSRTARVYPFVFVLAVIVTYFFFLLLRGDRSRRNWAIFVASSMVAYFTHFTLVALAPVQLIILRTHPREDRVLFRRWLLVQALATIPMMLWTAALAANLDLENAEGWSRQPGLGDIPTTVLSMTVGHNQPPGDSIAWTLWPGILAAMLGLAAGTWQSVRSRNQEWQFHSLVVFLSILAAFMISILVAPVYVDRYFMVVLPSLVVLIVLGAGVLGRRLGNMVLAVVLVTSTYNILHIFDHDNHKRADWQGAMAYLADEIQSGDVIVIGKQHTATAFWHHFPGSTSIKTVVLDNLSADEAIVPDSGRAWVVYRNPIENLHWLGVMPDFDPLKPQQAEIGNWLIHQEDQITEILAFRGIKIILLDLAETKNP